jgi:hypothetical protein
MKMCIRNFVMLMTLVGMGLFGGAQTGYAAGGSPPAGPIDEATTGAKLKLACGQEVEGFADVVGENMYRAMLTVQCRAMVGGIVGMFKDGQYALAETPKWQCVEIPEDLHDMITTFVTWVGRRPALLRKPAAVAFIEAIELSAPCTSS